MPKTSTAKSPSKRSARKRASLPVDMASSPKDRRGDFVRLAKGRTHAALKQIKLIGNLSVRSGYEYSAEDVTRIFGAIEREVAASRARFLAEMSRGQATVDFA